MLSADAYEELDKAGFTVIPEALRAEDLASVAAAYDAAVESAAPDDIRVGSSTTRVSGLINCGPEFDALYLHPLVLNACRRILNEPFRLSTMHARTLRPMTAAQNLHVDYERDSRGWTLIGFIYMVDAFRDDNGATRFLPGSHLWSKMPPELLAGSKADYPGQVLACGAAGSMILFNGSVWHGHGANRSADPRRSIQAAYIRRDAESKADLTTHVLPETLSRLSPLANLCSWSNGLHPRQNSGYPTSREKRARCGAPGDRCGDRAKAL
jgi:ectoine hydroxylase-related dioxygenase (phytanoyl-CoA dioxygenase family)